MLATLTTAVVSGLRGELVRVEVDVAPGLPFCRIVGLPDTALSEARERVRAAIRNAGFEYPLSRITVNLAPADRPKQGSAYDLAIAVGILLASTQIRAPDGPWALLGELSLGGDVQAIPGVLPMVATLAAAGHRRIAVPEANVGEARLVAGVEAVGVEGLDDAARLVAGPRGRRAEAARRRPAVTLEHGRSEVGGRPHRAARPALALTPDRLAPVDLRAVRGQSHGRWALEVALAGEHNLLLVGPPGAGKTLLARSVPTLLPELDDAESLEVTVIQSVAGALRSTSGALRRRPFRAPHHTSSYAALVGGGPRLTPGEVTLAHRGVLFLDELAEFERAALDALREPLEEGSVLVSRAGGNVRYPAQVQLIAATNPCRCGRYGDPTGVCRCLPGEPERYLRRVSGPLLDRIDLCVELGRVPPETLVTGPEPESSADVARRIASARRVATARNRGRSNGRLEGDEVLGVARLTATARRRLVEISTLRQLSARGIHRLLRVARTVADLRGEPGIDETELLAAAGLRDPEGKMLTGLAA